MKKIHHTTRTKAEKSGIILTAGIDHVEAKMPRVNRTVHASDAKAAVALIELNAKLVDMGYNRGHVQYDLASAMYELTVDGEATDVNWSELPDFADVLEAAGDHELSLEPEDEDEVEEGSGSVVSAKYKQEYQARGNADHCSDWLALTLEGRFTYPIARYGKDAKGEPKRLKDGEGFDADKFDDMLTKNGVELAGKWYDARVKMANGWQGRYRMNGRQKLEKKVAEAGRLLVREGDNWLVLIPEADWLDRMRAKHGVEVETN